MSNVTTAPPGIDEAAAAPVTSRSPEFRAKLCPEPDQTETPSLNLSFRASRFAERLTLAWWFPQIDDDEEKSWRIWMSRRSRALLTQICLLVAVLLTNVALTAFALGSYGSDKGVGLIYRGDCSKVANLNQWLHLAINLLGTGLLSASNYCMQLQAAPTRAAIDEAHKAGKYLEIGVPSLANLGYASNWRRFSWALLALSSLPIHLM